MRYIGGKSRIAAPLADVIKEHGKGRKIYLEPFLGGASIAAKVVPHFPAAFLADTVPDVALMWSAAADGWTPPDCLTEAEYQDHKADTTPSALRGFAGFGCSFGGKWFGGYARSSGRSIPAESSRRIAAYGAALHGAHITRADYRDFTGWIRAYGQDVVIYCDPPYAGTTGYAAAGAWDAGAFWATAREWVDAGAIVPVSEYAAPDGWEPVWERPHRQHLGGVAKTERPATMERLFKFAGAAEASK